MTIYDDALSGMITTLFAHEDEAAKRARVDSPSLGLPAISINPEEGRFLQLLVAASGTRTAVEIGTLGGYSAIWIARGLPPDGRLLTIDVKPEHTEVARGHVEAAGLSEKVEFLVGDAHERLTELSARGPFDFVFIDAEKRGYPMYYEWALANLRPGGTVCAHNAFRSGKILADQPDEDTATTLKFLMTVAQDPRVISSIYPGGDGTLVAVKAK